MMGRKKEREREKGNGKKKEMAKTEFRSNGFWLLYCSKKHKIEEAKVEKKKPGCLIIDLKGL